MRSLPRRSSKPASPLVAALLSSLCAGLGQLYCGRRTRALALLVGSLLFAPAVLLAAWGLPTSETSLIAVVVAAASFVGVSVFAVVDAVRVALSASPAASSPPLRMGVGLAWAVIGLGYPLVTTHALRAQVMAAYHIPTASMAPALLPGDRVLTDRSARTLAQLRRGDLVVFSHPDGSGRHHVKRVIGLPGEEIQVIDGLVRINGTPLERRDLGPSDTDAFGPTVAGTRTAWEVSEDGGWRVLNTSGCPPCPPVTRVLASDELFVLGDHRDKAVDSRSFGPIQLESIEGIVRYLWWPGHGLDRFGVLEGAAAVPPSER